MKNFILLIFLSICFMGCSTKWEYKTVNATKKPNSDFQSNIIYLEGETLNTYGEEGWELISVMDQIETVHPNFGNKDYVTGLQPNVRTSEITLIFKRKK